MGAIFKVLNTFLGFIAIVTCLAAVCIIAYSIIRPDLSRFGIGPGTGIVIGSEEEPGDPVETPDVSPGDSEEVSGVHKHEFTSVTVEEPTCIKAGRSKDLCDCGDFTFGLIPATGHSGEWKTTLAPTFTLAGERVMSCTVCDHIIKREVLAPLAEVTASPTPSPHVHTYVASIQSEPTCTVAGIRVYNCACGSFYQESISSIGHLAADWVVSVQATTSRPGFRQRICNVCHTLLDSQQIPQLPPPGPSPSPTPSPGAGQSPPPSPSPSPTPCTNHVEVRYESKRPTCVTQGSTTINCSNAGCGYEHIIPIAINKNNHDFNASGICRLCGTARSASPSPSP